MIKQPSGWSWSIYHIGHAILGLYCSILGSLCYFPPVGLGLSFGDMATKMIAT